VFREHVDHRAILVVEQARRDVDAEIRGDADEILLEGAVVDRAETEAVRFSRISRYSNILNS